MAGGALSRDGLGSPGWGLGMSQPPGRAPSWGPARPSSFWGAVILQVLRAAQKLSIPPAGSQNLTWSQPHSPLSIWSPTTLYFAPLGIAHPGRGPWGPATGLFSAQDGPSPGSLLQVPSLLQEHFSLCPPPSLTYPGCPVHPPNPGHVLPRRRPFLENNKLGRTTPVPTGLSCATSWQCPDAPGLCPPGYLWPFLACGWCPVQPGALWL